MPCRFSFHDDQMDSLTANLPSPPDLRKASGHETDVPMTLITGLTHTETPSGYVSSLAPIPMPLSSSSSLPNFQTHTLPFSNQFNGVNELSTPTLSRTLSTGTGLQNWRWKKLNPRVIPEQGLWNISSIVVGDVRDRHGFQVDGWHQAAQLANYWRRHFGVPEDPHPYHDFDTHEQTETTDAASALPNLSQPPVPITQLAWLLHSILCQDPAGNDSILQALSMASPAPSSVPPLSSESLKHDGLVHLAGHLAILANVLAQHRAASSEIPDDPST